MKLTDKLTSVLSASPASTYQCAELVEATPQETETALKQLASKGLARKTGSGSWIRVIEDEKRSEAKMPKRKA